MDTEKKLYPDLMTEKELVDYLRIPEISSAKNYKRVIAYLRFRRGLPKIRLCKTMLFPLEAVRKWVEKETDYNE